MNAFYAAILNMVAGAITSEVEKAPEDIARDALDLVSAFAPTALAEYLTAKDAAGADAAVDVAEEAKLAVKAAGG